MVKGKNVHNDITLPFQAPCCSAYGSGGERKRFVDHLQEHLKAVRVGWSISVNGCL